MSALFHKVYRFASMGNRRARLLRLANLVELRYQRPKLLTYPPFLCIDPGPVCNLRCLCCPTGEGTSKLKPEFMTPETFEKVVGNIRVDRFAHVCLYRLGEPLLNPHLNEFIAYFARRGIYTTISVNFSADDYDDAYLEGLVKSGLSEISVSVDGTTQETYAKYRVGGDVKRVLGNMKRLAKVKAGLRSKTPAIVYKMLLNRFNQHQVDEAKALAAEMQAEFYQPHFFWTPEGEEDEWTADDFREKYAGTRQTYVETDERHRFVDTECRQLWDTLHVNANGDMYPCCFCVEPQFAVGNLAEQHVDELWNSTHMQEMRRYVVDAQAPRPSAPTPCPWCSHRFCTYWNQQAQ